MPLAMSLMVMPAPMVLFRNGLLMQLASETPKRSVQPVRFFATPLACFSSKLMMYVSPL